MPQLGWSFLAAALLAASTGCVSRNVDVIPFLPPTSTPSLDELLAHIDQWENVVSLVLRVDLQFETVEEAEEGRGRQYRTAQGRLLLERPASIRLNIEAPILSADIAEMASNGERFQLLIHPVEYRALIEGSNRARYDDEMARLDEDPELEKAGPLVNIRPQHFTDAFLMPPVQGGPRSVALLHEERAVERDPRPGADDEARVRKSYFVVTTGDLGEAAVTRRYWFDRVGDVTLDRQQVYDEGGALVTDIRYSDYLPPDPESGVSLPSRVRIERPGDDYALALVIQQGGAEINRELPESAFVLEPPPEWEETLRRIDLDERARRPSSLQ